MLQESRVSLQLLDVDQGPPTTSAGHAPLELPDST